ncbi:MAG: hypothetical protein CLLPBCKN_007969 [Chroococcidiopsis cubana SAG 39.79]|nr:twin-arginine translocation signal domain-containing protein [Chroococcidiopsis cubana]MDZ4878534.1 hypothetical protein [Chroococcidiopsis cubana SAG 39.79]
MRYGDDSKNGFVGRRNLLKLMGVGGASVAATTVVSSSWGAQPAVAQQTDTQENQSPLVQMMLSRD